MHRRAAFFCVTSSTHTHTRNRPRIATRQCASHNYVLYGQFSRNLYVMCGNRNWFLLTLGWGEKRMCVGLWFWILRPEAIRSKIAYQPTCSFDYYTDQQEKRETIGVIGNTPVFPMFKWCRVPFARQCSIDLPVEIQSVCCSVLFGPQISGPLGPKSQIGTFFCPALCILYVYMYLRYLFFKRLHFVTLILK